jgi:hypothetical protein
MPKKRPDKKCDFTIFDVTLFTRKRSDRDIRHALAHIIHFLGKIMSKISEFATAQNAFNDRMDVAVTGLQGDVKALNDEIAKLQGSAGEVTPEDQASLDAIQARAETITTKLEALDAMTAPKPPVS